MQIYQRYKAHFDTLIGPFWCGTKHQKNISGYRLEKLQITYRGAPTPSDNPQERQANVLREHRGHFLGVYQYQSHRGQAETRDRPLLILAPGLGGDESSPYARWVAQEALYLGFDTLLVSPRGSGGSSPGFYHGGWYQDLILASQHPRLAHYTQRYLAGFSMGGHVACRIASAQESRGIFESIFACCPPLDLRSTGQHIDQQSWRVYRRYLVEGIKVVSRRLLANPDQDAFPLTPHILEGLKLSLDVDTLRMFDHYVISRMLGYESAEEYYEYESAVRYLDQIHTMTLCTFNQFDPFIPADIQRSLIPEALEGHPLFSVQTYLSGGHIYGGKMLKKDSALAALFQWLDHSSKT